MTQDEKEERLWNFLIDKYHSWGYRPIVRRCKRYLIHLASHLAGCIGFADAVRLLWNN